MAHRKDIETAQRERDLFSLSRSIILYDVTNSHFEGFCAFPVNHENLGPTPPEPHGHLKKHILRSLKNSRAIASPRLPERLRKLLYAATRHTAAELIVNRADSEKSNMALTHWNGSRVRKQDISEADAQDL